MPFHAKKAPHRSIPVPSRVEWEALCDMFGIQSKGDLAKALELATQLQDCDRAMLKHRSSERDELLRRDREVRRLALRRSYGELNDDLRPPNTISDLATMPALIKLDYSRLCTWYVQHLLAQVHAWSIDGTEQERALAKGLSERLGKALTLSKGRGRPSSLLTPDEALRSYKSDLERVKKVWIIPSRTTGSRLREALVNAFADYGQRMIPSATLLCGHEATPSAVTSLITAGRHEVSVRHLQVLLARARKAPDSPGT